MVVTDSVITGQELVLTIPFKLSNCPVGYCPPRVSSRAEVSLTLKLNSILYIYMNINHTCMLIT